MKNFWASHYYPILGVLIIALMALSFLLGRQTKREESHTGVTLSCTDEVLTALSIPVAALAGGGEPGAPAVAGATASVEGGNVAAQGRFFGSKNGTKYYTPGCSAGKRIKPENYVWFSDETEALLQGYTPANC